MVSSIRNDGYESRWFSYQKVVCLRDWSHGGETEGRMRAADALWGVMYRDGHAASDRMGFVPMFGTYEEQQPLTASRHVCVSKASAQIVTRCVVQEGHV